MQQKTQVYSRSKKNTETPLFISIQIIVQEKKKKN